MQSEVDRGLAEHALLPPERQWAAGGDGDSPYSGLGDGDGGDDCDDDSSSNDSEDDGDWSCSGPEQRDQAALVIQDAWRRRQLAMLEPSESASELEALNSLRRATEPASQSASCCIVCFALVPPRSLELTAASGGVDEGAAGAKEDVEDGDVPLCADCVHHLAPVDAALARPKATAGSGAVVNAPTRLTHLLRVEAKVNDQLQLLRNQHRLLLAQQEQLQATKRALAEQAVAAKALARERRRHVRMLLERRK